MVKCPKCETPNPDGTRFCSACGADLTDTAGDGATPTAAICPACDAENQTGSYCTECGHALATGAGSGEPATADTDTDVNGGAAASFSQDTLEMTEVVVEVQTDKRYTLGDYDVFNVRVTNVSERDWRITVATKIRMLEQFDFERSYLLLRNARQEVYGFQFHADKPGRFLVDSLTVQLLDPEHKENIKVYSLPNDSISLRVRSPKDKSGDEGVKIEGVTINLEAYGSDVGDIFNAASRRSGQTTIEQPKWQAISLLPDPEATHRAIEAAREGDATEEKSTELLVVDGLPRGKTESGVLVLDGVAHRRFFVFAKPEIWLGRDKGSKDGSVTNDVILRLLPCRSMEEDSENWRANRRFSRTHLKLGLGKEGACVEDGGTACGTYLGARRLKPGQRKQLPDSCRIGVAGELELDVRTYDAAEPAETFTTRYDRVVVVKGAPDGGRNVIGMESACPVNCVRVRRVENCEEHEYLLLFRQALIGNNRDNPIHVPVDGVDRFHAHLLCYDGELFLRKASESVEVKIGGHELGPDELAPLTPGTEITLGPAMLRFAAIEGNHFKRV